MSNLIYSSNLKDALRLEMAVPLDANDCEKSNTSIIARSLVKSLSEHLSICADEGTITTSDFISEQGTHIRLFGKALDDDLVDYLRSIGFSIGEGVIKHIMLNFTLKPLYMVDGYPEPIEEDDSLVGILLLEKIHVSYH